MKLSPFAKILRAKVRRKPHLEAFYEVEAALFRGLLTKEEALAILDDLRPTPAKP